MYAFAWFGLVALILYTSIVNFITYAQLPAKPFGYMRAKSEEAIAAAQKLPKKGDEDFQTAVADYSQLLMESGAFKRAARTAKFTNDTRQLATAQLAARNWPAAYKIMSDALNVDSQKVPFDAAVVARDYNNLGVLHYLAGASASTESERAHQLKDAADCFNRARKLAAAPNSEVLRLSLDENQSLLAEWHHQFKQARELREDAETVRRALNVSVPSIVR